MSESHLCPSWAVSVGYLAVASAAVLSNFGSAVRMHDIFSLHRLDRIFEMVKLLIQWTMILIIELLLEDTPLLNSSRTFFISRICFIVTTLMETVGYMESGC